MTELGYNIKKEWRNESDAHKDLNELNHPHIIRGLAAIHQGRKYHLLLEWANGGSLQSFWEKQMPRPTMTKDSIVHLLRQFVGLVEALHGMHKRAVVGSRNNSPNRGSSIRSRTSNASRSESVKYPGIIQEEHKKQSQTNGTAGDRGESSMPSIRFHLSDDDPFTESFTAESLTKKRAAEQAPRSDQSPPTIAIETVDLEPLSGSSSVEGGSLQLQPDTLNWRHGDIKPGNILRFTDDMNMLGILKLADLGRAKLHTKATHARPGVEIDCKSIHPVVTQTFHDYEYPVAQRL